MAKRPAALLRPRIERSRSPNRGPECPVEASIETPESQSAPRSPESGPESGFAVAIATAGGAGYAPVAPGTFGSLVGVGVYLLLADLQLVLFGITLFALSFLGIWASDAAERHFGQSDDGRIVIDEVVGQLLTLAPLVALAPVAGPRGPGWLLAGFLLFRLLDIWKPFPIGWAERSFRGGVGVMMDDIFAGVLGAVLLGAALGLGGA